MDEEVLDEDKLHPEYLSVHEYTWVDTEHENGESNMLRAIGYVTHECKDCVVLAPILVKCEDYYLPGELLIIYLENVESKTIIREGVDIGR